MGQELERVELLLKDKLEILKNATVFVVGCGGVGSYAIEALARTGVGHLIIMDKDVVSESNLNRQMMATYQTIGVEKTHALKQRILSYQKDCKVECIDAFFDSSYADILERVDFVIDAIDTVTAKLDLIELCHQKKIPFISSTGMGNRFDPSKVKYCDLWETSYDPLSKSMRVMAKKRGINYAIPVVFSQEIPQKQNMVVNQDGKTRKDRIPPASVVFVPASAGLLCASICVRTLTGMIR